MSPWFHRSLLWLAPLVAAGLTCAFPTDKSDQVVVVVQSSGGVVIRGQELDLVARAFRVIGTDTVEVTNVSFQWSSGNATLATVQDDGGGHAHVTGVNSGTVEITARAVAYEQSDAGSLMVRVANALEVDSVRPRLVKYGDTVTVYGVGVDSIFLASLGGATLLDYPIPFFLPTRSRDSLGYAQATFWVPPPARSARLSYIGPGVFGEAPESTMVLPADVLEPNEAAPYPINLDAAPRFPTLPFFKFFNPALAFEIPKRDEIGVEWYRFDQTNSRDLTLILSGPEVRGTFSTFLTDQLSFDPADSSYDIGPASWTLGPGHHFCKGFPFEPPEVQPESTVVALLGMAGALHALALYTVPGRYGLAVIEGYVTSNPAFPRDDHEEDDYCDAVDPPRPLAALPPPGTGALRDTLSIDNAHDIDWIRFTQPGPAGQRVRIRTRVLVAPAADSTDIDLYLLTVPGGASPSMTTVAFSSKSTSDENITFLNLPPGDYYVVVLDYVGRPTSYEICIGLGTGGCNAFPLAPLAAPGGPRAAKAKPGQAPGPRPAVRR